MGQAQNGGRACPVCHCRGLGCRCGRCDDCDDAGEVVCDQCRAGQIPTLAGRTHWIVWGTQSPATVWVDCQQCNGTGRIACKACEDLPQ